MIAPDLCGKPENSPPSSCFPQAASYESTPGSNVILEIFSSNLLLWVEHPDLPSHPTTSQDVGLLIVEGEGGPCQGEEVLLDILVFVLHQDFPRVDVNDADGVAAAGCHPRCRLALLTRVGLKDNLKQVVVKTGENRSPKYSQNETCEIPK